MKSKLFFILIAVSIILLAACSDTNENNPDEEEVLVLGATLDVPEAAEVNEEVELLATVTYGEENVTDADEVVYEIWEEGKKDESTKIESTNNEDGTYTATTSFDHDGLFHVQVHVTARDMHTMPKLAITIGEGGHYEQTDEDTEDDHGHEETEEDEHGGH
ncbi:FixH family protein [Ornithinibacillus californiensis]|uniref:FixH family protein n=1 Tax=Ornithinibacillus californiensis TaxID=161536 RepID=UPI00069CD318|nr:FixH family protein [Ornithinibacillus californiensis]